MASASMESIREPRRSAAEWWLGRSLGRRTRRIPLIHRRNRRFRLRKGGASSLHTREGRRFKTRRAHHLLRFARIRTEATGSAKVLQTERTAAYVSDPHCTTRGSHRVAAAPDPGSARLREPRTDGRTPALVPREPPRCQLTTPTSITLASFRCALRRRPIVSASSKPVVIDHSTPEPTRSLANTSSVAWSARRQSRGTSGSPAPRAPAMLRPSPYNACRSSNPISRAMSSVPLAGPPHSISSHARIARSSLLRSVSRAGGDGGHGPRGTSKYPEEEREALLREAVAVAAPSEARLEHARGTRPRRAPRRPPRDRGSHEPRDRRGALRHPKAVAFHLGNVHRKLGISGRGELPPAL